MTLDPDLAGVGVLIGFIGTGLLATLGSNTASLLRVLGDQEHKFFVHRPKWRAFFIRCLTSISPKEAKDSVGFWRSILDAFVLNLSDQQLVTGLLLVLLALTTSLFDATTSSQEDDNPGTSDSLIVAADLGIFSMITHFATLSSLEEMLRNNITWAVFRMFLVLLTTAVWFILGASKIFISVYDPVTHNLVIADFGIATSVLEMLCIPWVFWSISLALFTSDATIQARESLEIIFPFRSGKLIQTFLLLLGIVNLGLDIKIYGVTAKWTFGQLLPAFMLFLPFFSLAEGYARMSRSHQNIKHPRAMKRADHNPESKLELSKQEEEATQASLSDRSDSVTSLVLGTQSIARHEVNSHSLEMIVLSRPMAGRNFWSPSNDGASRSGLLTTESITAAPIQTPGYLEAASNSTW